MDTNHNSKQYLALPNEIASSQSGYALTNAVDAQGLGFDYRHVEIPRMYGLDAHYQFGH